MTRPRYSLPRRPRRLRRYLERKPQKGGRKFPWIHMRVREHSLDPTSSTFRMESRKEPEVGTSLSGTASPARFVLWTASTNRGQRGPPIYLALTAPRLLVMGCGWVSAIMSASLYFAAIFSRQSR